MHSICFLNVQLSPSKNLLMSLKKIVGLSFFNALRVCIYFGFNRRSCCSSLTPIVLKKMQLFCVSNFILQDQLYYNTKQHIGALISLKTIKGLRHKLKLPVRGQRTHTNRKTARRSLASALF